MCNQTMHKAVLGTAIVLLYVSSNLVSAGTFTRQRQQNVEQGAHIAADTRGFQRELNGDEAAHYYHSYGKGYRTKGNTGKMDGTHKGKGSSPIASPIRYVSPSSSPSSKTKMTTKGGKGKGKSYPQDDDDLYNDDDPYADAYFDDMEGVNMGNSSNVMGKGHQYPLVSKGGMGDSSKSSKETMAKMSKDSKSSSGKNGKGEKKHSYPLHTEGPIDGKMKSSKSISKGGSLIKPPRPSISKGTSPKMGKASPGQDSHDYYDNHVRGKMVKGKASVSKMSKTPPGKGMDKSSPDDDYYNDDAVYGKMGIMSTGGSAKKSHQYPVVHDDSDDSVEHGKMSNSGKMHKSGKMDKSVKMGKGEDEVDDDYYYDDYVDDDDGCYEIPSDDICCTCQCCPKAVPAHAFPLAKGKGASENSSRRGLMGNPKENGGNGKMTSKGKGRENYPVDPGDQDCECTCDTDCYKPVPPPHHTPSPVAPPTHSPTAPIPQSKPSPPVPPPAPPSSSPHKAPTRTPIKSPTKQPSFSPKKSDKGSTSKPDPETKSPERYPVAPTPKKASKNAAKTPENQKIPRIADEATSDGDVGSPYMSNRPPPASRRTNIMPWIIMLALCVCALFYMILKWRPRYETVDV